MSKGKISKGKISNTRRGKIPKGKMSKGKNVEKNIDVENDRISVLKNSDVRARCFILYFNTNKR